MVRQLIRSRKGSPIGEAGRPFLGRRKRCRRQAEDRAGRQQQAAAGAGFHPHQASLHCAPHRSFIESCTQGPRDAEGETRIMAVEPGLEPCASLAPLQNTLRALPDRKALRRQCDIVTWTNQRRGDGRRRASACCTFSSAKPKASSATRSVVGQRDGQGASEQNLANARQTFAASRANQPQVHCLGLHGNCR